jgi:ribosomal-protein-alanine N-acetyltransferase
MVTTGKLTFCKIDAATARQISGWRYPPPYDIYNCHPADMDAHVRLLLTPAYHYYTVRAENGQLIAFRCFGPDAQVPGGDYSAPALDMGGGLKPELTGQGLGAVVMQAAFAFARRQFAPPAFRTTVAAFNLRALRVCEQAHKSMFV